MFCFFLLLGGKPSWDAVFSGKTMRSFPLLQCFGSEFGLPELATKTAGSRQTMQQKLHQTICFFPGEIHPLSHRVKRMYGWQQLLYWTTIIVLLSQPIMGMDEGKRTLNRWDAVGSGVFHLCLNNGQIYGIICH